MNFLKRTLIEVVNSQFTCWQSFHLFVNLTFAVTAKAPSDTLAMMLYTMSSELGGATEVCFGT